MLHPIARLVTRRPRLLLAVWVCATALLALQGLGLEDKLTSKLVYVDGTDAKREHDLVVREFGGEDSLIVMLRGPRAAVDRQGPDLARRLEAMPRTVVVSPWDRGPSIDGLNPRSGVAALVVSVEQLREKTSDIADAVEAEIEAAIEPPVEASISGGPVVLDSLIDASAEAVSAGERIAVPALLVVLLLVFRSVLAAAIPLLIGGSVVAASRGVLDSLLSVTQLDVFALSTLSMLGLALGVDYSLLVVSRFREEIERADGDVAAAVRRTVATTGRSVIPAGCGLVLAMAVSMLVMPNSVVTSVAIAGIVATTLSMFSAILVVPAVLTLFGAQLDRWSLPRREAGGGVVRRWSLRLSRRPVLVLGAIWLMAVLSAWAFTLETKTGTAAMLPDDNRGRIQHEAVKEELGPGWVGPFEVAMSDSSGPVTTPQRLRALARFQGRVERDPGVQSMVGFARLERDVRPLRGFEDGLIAQERGFDRIGRGLGRAREGTEASAAGLHRAAGGAWQLDAAVAATRDGSGELAGGLRSASIGSERLDEGLGNVDKGSVRLAAKTADASGGADRLASGLQRASEQADEAESSARTLKNAMRTGDAALAGLEAPVRATEDQLAAALHALQEMGTGRGDPQFAAALAAVTAASRELTGTEPGSEGPARPPYEGVGVAIADARGQFDLGSYQADVLRDSGRRNSEGMAKLAQASARLDRGLAELAEGSRELSNGIEGLAGGSESLSPALRRLTLGAEGLKGGLGELAAASGELAGGLSEGAQRSGSLSGALARMHSGVGDAQEGGGFGQVREQSPGMFRSGYFYLASLDGSRPEQRGQAAFLVNLDRGGSAARMLVIPRDDPTSAEALETRDRLTALADDLARETGAEAVVGGPTANRADLDQMLRDQAPLARLALALVTFIVLVPVVRSLTLPIIAAVLNLLTVGATFGLLALLFNGSLLGGPGYIDTTVLPATVMLIFALAIDYEIFIFARMREEYERTGSPSAAISSALEGTAHVVTGAAAIMIVVFLSFSVSPLTMLRSFGLAQAIAVFLDAFVIRFVVIPGLMRALGRWSWWMPGWLDRLLPGRPLAVPKPAEKAA